MPKDDYRTVSEDAQNPEEQADIDEQKFDDGLHSQNPKNVKKYLLFSTNV